MKKVIILFAGIIIALSSIANNKVDTVKTLKLVILNDNRSRPIAITKEYFWQSKNLNEITFSGALYFDLLRYRLTKNKKDIVASYFPISAALIFTENCKSDTLYSNHFFKNWMLENETFVLTDDFVFNMFGSLYLGYFRFMKKGED